jgi:Zn finger protein HypA/HybF involved in hydrogenase expression
MKSWKCPCCAREKESDDDVIMVVCPGCQVEMVIKDGDKKSG